MKSILLILFLVVGLFGSNSEEIGTPYVEQGNSIALGSVLDPNGKYFYTFVGNTITKWELDPIKKVSAFKVDLPKDRRKAYLHITSDSKKMILWNLARITLIDLLTKKVIRTVNRTRSDHLEYYFRWGEIDDLTFKAIFYKNDGTQTIYKEYDTKNLNVIRNVVLPKLDSNVDVDDSDMRNTIDSMHIHGNNIFVFARESTNSSYMAILDKKTLEKISIVKNRYMSHMEYISLDKKSFYFKYAHTEFNLDTLLSKKITFKEFNESIPYFRANISLYKELTLVPRYYNSLNKHYNNFPMFYNNVKNKKLATFYQFEDDWILIAPNGNFEASKNIRKYLKMKTSSGKVVPINNATFQKYNKKIKLIKG
ncbi:MAG: Unknown protein [uncultured Sulfurovum sp.]|uniref:Uncharacterized protein n=1 Tax=uncultured Sulfurovum sp. TaxID=269237 RepID=A0A6S6RXN0_9BACT|nr:MAG: Unknown protein [uncultured Sulfurovum sp.]